MDDSLGARALNRRVEIGVEHAGLAAELEFEAGTLSNLESRRAKALHELTRGHSKKAAAHLRHRPDRAWRRRLLRIGGTGGQEQGGGK